MKREDPIMLPNHQITTQNGFNISWEAQETETTEYFDGFRSPREWQTEAFSELKDASHMILNAPMGSGKSLMMCFLSAYKMKTNPKLRCIIAVPQTIIASGFIYEKLLFPDGEKVIWAPSHNLCEKEDSTSTVAYLIRWLETPTASFEDRALICTHSTLVLVYKELITKKRADLFENFLLWVDEAHHVKNSLAKGNNGIGSLVTELLAKVDKGVQVGLTTATFFRGDRDSLITQDKEELFKRVNLPYDQYLKTMKHLKSFSFDFLICGQDYMKAIDLLIKQRSGKDVIYIPKPKSRHSQGCKYKEVSDIIAIYENQYEGQILEGDDGLTIVQGDNACFKILDLVDEDRRTAKKGFLTDKTLQKKRDFLDVIIALDMFKEGANWIWADRSIIVGPRGSLVDVIQMIGRLFRDAEGKEHVEVIQLLPFSLNQQADDFKDNLNNYLKAIYSLLILEDILKPIKILTPKRESEAKGNTSSEKTTQSPRLYELIPDENKRKSAIETATKYLINVSADSENQAMGLSEVYEAFQKGLPTLLKELHLNNSSDAKLLGDHIWSAHLRRTFKAQGIDVEHINFDIVQTTHPLDGLISFTSGTCDINTFQKLRAAIEINRPPLSMSKIIGWIRDHYNEHGVYPLKESGIIPYAQAEFEGETWLKVNSALRGGNRDLPGGSTLARLLEKEFGVKNKMNLPNYTEEQILEWVHLYHAKYNKLPNSKSGAIEFASGDFKDETWAKVDHALLSGNRSLPGGSSLAIFLGRGFSKRKTVNPSGLTKALICKWIELYHAKYKKYPTKTSGGIEFATNDFENETWETVNGALSRGYRGLPKGSSLPKLIEEEFGVKNRANLPNYTRSQIVGWINQYHSKYSKYPTRDSGTIEFAIDDFKGETWAKVDTALNIGGRGFLKGSSLPKLLDEEFGVKNHMDLPNFTLAQILDWVNQHHDKYDRYPIRNSGPIEFVSGDFKRETWAKIDRALVQGGRGLNGKSSLAKLLEEEFGIRNRKNLPQLTKHQIINWIEQYHVKHNKYPNSKSGPIEFASSDLNGETWGRIQTALLEGLRGLPKGSSLPKLLEEEFGVKNHMNRPSYTKKQIIEWIELYHAKHKEYPHTKSGLIEFATEEFKDETWAKVNNALTNGNRGLSKGSSLDKLIKEISKM